MEQSSSRQQSTSSLLKEKFALVSQDKSGLDEVNLELEDRRKFLLTEFESLKLKKNALMAKDSDITDNWTVLSNRLTKINEKKMTLQKHDIEIEKAYKMLDEAFKMMGEEKEGVIRVHKEAEREGRGTGRQVQAVSRRNDPASG